ncbi:sigma-70 family RNA polymerase sigma factor [Kitasatospora sp. NPDC001159]
MNSESGSETVAAAQAGDAAARERLIADHLPLIYNIVGRALDGHADVDDVVQETMLRVVHSLDTLREPSSFRSWLVAVAMNEVRRRWTARKAAPVPGLQELTQVGDPAADFVDLTILRLGLTGQRREVAEATRWLDERDRDLLSLWWLETGGELTRAELATALSLTPQHTAVRVQRMKEQLEIGRLVVRALAADPPCAELSALTTTWDGKPAVLWRKRIARHARNCPHCAGHQHSLVPVEGLLAGLPLLLPPPHLAASPHLAAFATTAAQQALSRTARATTRSAAPTRRSRPRDGRAVRTAKAAGAVAVALTVLAGVQILRPGPDHTAPAPSVAVTLASPAPAPATPSPAPTVTEPQSPPATTTPPHQAAPTPTPSSPTPQKTLEQQLVDLINIRRAENGCRPLRVNRRLHAAAQGHSDDMAVAGYFDHVDPRGNHADGRMTAAGYQWSAWAENLDRNTNSPNTVLKDWSDGAIHQQNMLDCQYTDAGVGTAPTPNGLLWTLDLGSPG